MSMLLCYNKLSIAEEFLYYSINTIEILIMRFYNNFKGGENEVESSENKREGL